MKLGNYRIGQHIFDIIGELTEISVSDYRTFEQAFEDEKIYRGRDIKYLGADWKTMVCVTENKIYKISLATDCITTFAKSRDESGFWNKVYRDLIKDYGMCTKELEDEKSRSIYTIWERNREAVIFTRTYWGDINASDFRMVLNIGIVADVNPKGMMFGKKFFSR